MEDNWRSSEKPIIIGDVEFDPCFDSTKIRMIERHIPGAQVNIRELVKIEVKLPERIECLSDEEIAFYAKRDGGHGLYADGTIRINPHMTPRGILLNYIHENIHHVLPDASENLVDHLTDLVAYQMNLKR